MHGKERIAFLDYLRVVACFMVMVIHSCEPFYLGGDGTLVANRWDALCVTVVECLCRVCVPLFVMASSYLLFPLAQPTGAFFRRRIARIAVPFLVWPAAYIWWSGDSWGKACFNFPQNPETGALDLWLTGGSESTFTRGGADETPTR